MSHDSVPKVTSDYKNAGPFSELFFTWLNPLISVFFFKLCD